MNKFDEAAREWDSRPDIVERNKVIGAELLRRIPLDSAMRVLDFGAGTGLMSVFFADYVSEVVAADTSSGMIDVLSAKLEKMQITNVSPVLIDGAQNEALNGIYDLIFTGMTLHHVKDARSILARFAELSAPRGWIAIADLASEDGSFHGDRPDVHHHGFDETELKETLYELGYANGSSSHIHTMKRGPEKKEFPVFLLTAQMD